MRRLFPRALALFLGLLFGAGGAGAFDETAIQDAVTGVRNQVEADWSVILGPTCGGLLNAADPRLGVHYRRLPDQIQCEPAWWCTEYDEATGACTGSRCVLTYREGLGTTAHLEECGSSGTCTPVVPRVRCPLSYWPTPLTMLEFQESPLRAYRCWKGRPTSSAPPPSCPSTGSAVSSDADACCYSYDPNFYASLKYDDSLFYDQLFKYFPFNYNCTLTYASSPVTGGVRGEPSLQAPRAFPFIPRPAQGGWEATPGSNVTVRSGDDPRAPHDGSLPLLELDSAGMTSIRRVVQPTERTFTQHGEEPDLFVDPHLSQTLEQLLHPPEVRLILPEGSLGLQGSGSRLFTRLFKVPERSLPVEETIGAPPEALLLAAEELRRTPLLRVRYEPVRIFLPFASATRLKVLLEEWRTWPLELQEVAAEHALSIPPNLLDLAKHNEEALRSTLALEESLREYRLHFPRYLDALLSYVEAANRFFAEEWAQVNADRLLAWHEAYESYLPELQKELATLYAQAAKVTQECLVPACRLNVLPVTNGVRLSDVLPMEFDLGSHFAEEFGKVWNLTAFPLYENVQGRLALAPSRPAPPLSSSFYGGVPALGLPLPDLTFDFSEMARPRTIEVPIVTMELAPLDLSSPPLLPPEPTQADLDTLLPAIVPLPRFAPPLPELSFPPLTLPDPKTSLLLLPEPPKVLDLWKEVIEWRAERLDALLSVCDPLNTSPKTFLIHEEHLTQEAFAGDAAQIRAAAFVRGNIPQYTIGGGMGSFPPRLPVPFLPHPNYPLGFYPQGFSFLAPLRIEPLREASPCPECSRPQRFLRQHASLEVSWGELQEQFLRAVDEWDAQVQYWTVVQRAELVEVERGDSPPEPP